MLRVPRAAAALLSNGTITAPLVGGMGDGGGDSIFCVALMYRVDGADEHIG